MYIAKIKNFNISNGKGIGVSLYVSGCHFRCKGCFNFEAWDPTYGKPFDQSVMDELITKLADPAIDHFSILGGEPLDPYNVVTVYEIAKTVKTTFPDKKIWLWTGYEKEDLNDQQKLVTDLADYVTYGPFIEERKDINRLYSGSDNQYTLDKYGAYIEAPAIEK